MKYKVPTNDKKIVECEGEPVVIFGLQCFVKKVIPVPGIKSPYEDDWNVCELTTGLLLPKSIGRSAEMAVSRAKKHARRIEKANRKPYAEIIADSIKGRDVINEKSE